MKQDFITVNGRAYDPVTGMPLKTPIKSAAKTQPAAKKTETSAVSTRGTKTSDIHQKAIQKSSTLRRRHVRPATRSSIVNRRTPARKHVDIAKAGQIQKFATQNIAPAAKSPVKSIDRPAETHPLVYRARKQPKKIDPMSIRRNQKIANLTPHSAIVAHNLPTQTAKQPVLKSAQTLKNEAVSAALAKEMAPQKPHHAKKRAGGFKKWFSVASAGLAIMLLGGYFTYLSMPNISIRVAAIQSGVDAKYPSYRPSGYALSGPISFKQGEVNMKFAYADGTTGYTISQKQSDWDSEAAKEFVTEKSGTPTTTTVDGLTIFTSGEDVVWVNGGILYHINSQAPLSGEQIRKIATSM